MPSATLNSRCSRATAQASAPRIHPCSFDPMAGFSSHHGREDGDHISAADLVKTPVHERTAIPLESALPVLRSEPLPRCRLRRPAHTPCGTFGILDGRTLCGRVPATARHLTIGERGRRAPRRVRRTDTRRAPGHGACPQTVNRWTQWRLRPPGSTTRKSVPPSLCRPGCNVPICLALSRPAIWISPHVCIPRIYHIRAWKP